jgi:hypothetical protein
MTVVVLQPGFLPWLGFFDQLRQADRFIVYDDAQYTVRDWRSRNRVKTPHGVRYLTVPVEHGGARRPIREVRIAEDGRWAQAHLRTLAESYARAPHLEPLLGEIADVLGRPPPLLLDLDMALIEVLARALGIRTDHVVMASALGGAPGKNQRLVELCRAVGGDDYLTGDAARGYLDEEQFAAAGIRVRYHGYLHPTYRQLHGEFVPHLSAVDLLFNEGPAAAAILAGAAP